MIYTLTFNPAIDCYVQCGEVKLGQTNRAKTQTLAFGGKGVNVSVMLARLGVATTALGFVAGDMGEALCRYLTTEGVTEAMIRLPNGHTRINVKLNISGEGVPATETEINAPGPHIPLTSMADLEAQLQKLGAGDILVLSGSVPSHLPKDMYGSIAQKMQAQGVALVVDAEGELLLGTLPYAPLLIKPNLQELSAIVGKPLVGIENLADVQAGIAYLQSLGARHVLVSMGGQGAMLASEGGEVYVSPALGGKAVQTVGAGDAMLAGFLAGMGQGLGYGLKLGLATGGATAMTYGLAQKSAVDALLQEAET